MATKKETFNVKGCELTLNEKMVFESIAPNEKVSYKDLKVKCESLANTSDKSLIGTLARLESKHGLLIKNEGKKGTFYKVNNEMLESADLSKITDKEKNVLNACKTLANDFNYKDIQVDNMTDKAKIATLARLNTTYGVLDKVETSTLTTYEIKGE